MLFFGQQYVANYILFNCLVLAYDLTLTFRDTLWAFCFCFLKGWWWIRLDWTDKRTFLCLGWRSWHSQRRLEMDRWYTIQSHGVSRVVFYWAKFWVPRMCNNGFRKVVGKKLLLWVLLSLWESRWVYFYIYIKQQNLSLMQGNLYAT